MNSKMRTNSQLETNEPKKKEKKTMKTKSKQTRTGTESEKWTSHGRFSVGRRRGEIGGKGTWGRRRSIIGRHKIDRERLRIV